MTKKRKLRINVPTKDSVLLPWGKNFVFWVVLKHVEWLISEALAAALAAKYEAYAVDMVNLAADPASPELLAQKDIDKAIFIAAAEALLNYQLRNPDIPEAELTAAGAYESPDTRTSDTEIGLHPEVEFFGRQCNETTVRTRREGSAKWRIPVEKRCRGIQYRGILLESRHSAVPPAEACPISGGGSRHKFTVCLGNAASGKWFAVYVRYTNHFRIPGPWGGPFGTTIL